MLSLLWACAWFSSVILPASIAFVEVAYVKCNEFPVTVGKT